MPKLWSVLSVLFIVAIAGNTGSASPIITTPSGLKSGDHFRVVFVTYNNFQISTYVPESPFDDFVTADAQGATYNDKIITWQAIECSVHDSYGAFHICEDRKGQNLGYTPVPISLPDGELVSLTGLFSQGEVYTFFPLLLPINVHIDGSKMDTSGNDADWVWTGFQSGCFLSLGGSLLDGNTVWPRTDYGHANSTDVTYVYDSNNAPISPTEYLPMYGISEYLTVVPEPSTAILAGMGSLVALAYSLKRKQYNLGQQASCGCRNGERFN